MTSKTEWGILLIAVLCVGVVITKAVKDYSSNKEAEQHLGRKYGVSCTASYIDLIQGEARTIMGNKPVEADLKEYCDSGKVSELTKMLAQNNIAKKQRDAIVAAGAVAGTTSRR